MAKQIKEMLNSNIRCIEIKQIAFALNYTEKLNSNIRCIEMKQLNKQAYEFAS